ncbi:hypothetical protein HY251_21890 [bacterium]|nr:hypothetical protein [bacterium]
MRRLSFLAITAVLSLALGPGALAQDAKKDDDKPKDGKKDDKPGDKPKDDKPATEEKNQVKDEGRDTKLPFNPFANVKPGEWVTFVAHVHRERVPPQAADVNVYTTWTVIPNPTEQGKLRLKAVQKGPGRPPTDLEKDLPTGDMTLGQFMAIFGVPDEAKLSDVKCEDAKLTVNGKEFSGKKISFEGGMVGRRAKEILTISTDVRCSFVQHEIIGPDAGDGKPEMSVKEEVLGFGTADKTEWGKSPEEVSKIQNEEEAKRPR